MFVYSKHKHVGRMKTNLRRFLEEMSTRLIKGSPPVFIAVTLSRNNNNDRSITVSIVNAINSFTPLLFGLTGTLTKYGRTSHENHFKKKRWIHFFIFLKNLDIKQRRIEIRCFLTTLPWQITFKRWLTNMIHFLGLGLLFISNKWYAGGKMNDSITTRKKPHEMSCDQKFVVSEKLHSWCRYYFVWYRMCWWKQTKIAWITSAATTTKTTAVTVVGAADANFLVNCANVSAWSHTKTYGWFYTRNSIPLTSQFKHLPNERG